LRSSTATPSLSWHASWNRASSPSTTSERRRTPSRRWRRKAGSDDVLASGGPRGTPLAVDVVRRSRVAGDARAAAQQRAPAVLAVDDCVGEVPRTVFMARQPRRAVRMAHGACGGPTGGGVRHGAGLRAVGAGCRARGDESTDAGPSAVARGGLAGGDSGGALLVVAAVASGSRGVASRDAGYAARPLRRGGTCHHGVAIHA